MGIRINAGRSGCGGRIGSTLFCGVFLIMGLVFTGLLLFAAAQQLDTWRWTPTPARIEQSEHAIDPGRAEDPYRFLVRYAYTQGGTPHTADAVTLNDGWTNDFREVQQAIVAFPVGATVEAFVDPDNPHRAVLVQEWPWMLLILPLPLIFVAVGGGGIWAAWRSGEPDDAATPISAGGTKPKKTRTVLTVVFSVFTVVGVAASAFFTMPLLRIWEARHWPATPAVVERSAVLEIDGDDGSTYQPDILYRYTVDGQTYRSNAYGFFGGSSSGLSSKAALVRQYDPGADTVCYVDPRDPTRAVLNRGFQLTLLFGLIPLVFAIIGVGGLFAVLTGRIAHPGQAADNDDADALFPSAVPPSPRSPADAQPLVLRSGSGRRTGAIFLALFALFWTGLSCFIWILAYREGDRFGIAFLSLFVLIGLAIGVAAIYKFLACFNPAVRLTLPRHALMPGETVTIDWALDGSAARLKDFVIRLVGTEHATYRRGTDTITDTHDFRTVEAMRLVDRRQIIIGRGRCDLTIPADTMHSFKSSHNEVCWTLHATGTIRRWPDVNDTWTIPLAPRRPGAAGEGDAV